MVICKIYGGLGNQFFQYCLGRQLALKNNCELKLDLSYFDNDGSWPFQLDFYNINYQGLIHKEELERLLTNSPWWNKFLPANRRLIAKDKNKAFHPEVLKYRSPCIIDGYWQSDKYFSDIETTIRLELDLKPEYLSSEYNAFLTQITQGSFVSLHVRRGDYVKVGAPLASISYYERAIEQIKNLVKNAQFVVFSDDIEWVKENINIDAPVIWMDNSLDLEDYESLQLMSKCDHHIIGNSTYSWWGAWLNKKDDKIVVYPKIAKTHLNKDLMPDDWIEI